jgi:hypothetical protein
MAFVAAGTLFNSAAAATGAVNIPTHSNGDELVFCVGWTQSGTSPAVNIITPTGGITWTARNSAEAGNASAIGGALFTATGDGSEASVTADCNGGTDNPRFIAQVIALSGRDGTYEEITPNQQESGIDIDSPSITPSLAGADIIRMFSFDDDQGSEADHDSDAGFLGTSSGYGEGPSPGNGMLAAFSYQENVPASATGTSTWSTLTDSDAGVALTIAVMASAGLSVLPILRRQLATARM